MDAFDLKKWQGFKKAGGDDSHNTIIDQVVIDSRQVTSNNALFVALKGGQEDGHHYIREAIAQGAKYILLKDSFSIPTDLESYFLRVPDPLTSLQELARAYRKELKLKMIAVTGSYGKTMVKDLLYKLLKTRYRVSASPESFNSQIGVPLSLFSFTAHDEYAIVEAAISEKHEMEKLVHMIIPDIGIMTAIGKKHLNTLGNLETLTEELLKLFTTTSLEWGLLPFSQSFNALDFKKNFWNQPEKDFPFAEKLSTAYETSIPYRIQFPSGDPVDGTMTSGFYYYLDLLNISIKTAWRLGITRDQIANVLKQHRVEPSRTEIWKSPLNVTFINDTYAQNPQSIDKALKFLNLMTHSKRKIFIFAGLKNVNDPQEYIKVGKLIAQNEIDLLCLIGSHPYAELIQQLPPKTSVVKVDSFKAAIDLYQRMMHAEDVVLIKGELKESLESLIKNFNESICTNLCYINLAAIEHNIDMIRQKLAPKTRIMCMVKALAYGTDDMRIAKFLKSCQIDILGVSYVDEGVSLKRNGVSQEIFVLNAAEYEINKVVRWNLQVAVSSFEFIQALDQEGQKQAKKIKVHLHIDTGMGRFGCRPDEALALALQIQNSSSLIFEGIMTHLSSADNPDEDLFTLSQIQSIDKIIQAIEAKGIQIPWKHVMNSAGALRFSAPQFNMVRIGLAVFGLYPSEECKEILDLRLALSLTSRLAGISKMKKGDSISYGRSYRIKNESERIGVIPIGYFDGIHRNYSSKSHVMIRGQKAPMVGNICMDFMMVDLTNIPQANLSDPVLIFGTDEHGDYLSPEEFAEKGNSIVHELMTCLGPRIQRIFIYEQPRDQKR